MIVHRSDLHFTMDARRALMEGMLVADEVEEMPEPDALYGDGAFPPAKGKFTINQIDIWRFRENMLRLDFVMSSGLKLASIDVHLEVSETVTLADAEFQIEMKLS